ncbi:MAG: methyl-accepting chemotaxis protein [Fidelibacterota bacterium]|nr:MAG: methyl-accepting chemotaxis protein [Candidatus Neomarinimicrobiota bacterium]
MANKLTIFKNVKIGKKLIIFFLTVGVIPLAAVGFLVYSQTAAALQEQVSNQLITVREMKKEMIEDYFGSIRNQIITLSEDQMIIDAMKEFTEAFFLMEAEYGRTFQRNRDDLLRGLIERYRYQQENTLGAAEDAALKWMPSMKVSHILQALYISRNPRPIGSKQELDYSPDNTTYSRLHRKYHPIIRGFLEKFEYSDIFLVESQTGHIVYSVLKEVDYTTSLLNGPYSDTNLARAFKSALSATDNDYVALVNFEQYEPSFNFPASFIASPIYDGDKKVGVLLFRVPVDKINYVMLSGKRWSEVGLGASGESYLVASDYTLRSDSRLLIDDEQSYFQTLEGGDFSDELIDNIKATGTSILFQSVRTKGTVAAIEAKATGFDIFPDYRNVSVLSAYTPLKIEGLEWVLMAEIDEAEAFDAIYALRNVVVIITVVIAALVVFIAIAVSRSFTNPIRELMMGITALGEGDLTAAVKVETRDEFGIMSSSFNETSANLRDVLKQIMSNSSQVENASSWISAASEQLVAGAEEQQSQLSEAVTAMEEMRAMVLEASKNATETRQNAQHAGTTTSQGRDVVIKMASGFEMVATAVEQAANQIQELSKHSEEIGNVIQVIDDIIDQTNLISLNANIQAARAGEAGRGFSVVADDVRKLADRTVNAAGEIGGMIESIQGNVQEAASSMEVIQDQSNDNLHLVDLSGRSLHEISESISQVAGAVGQIANFSKEQSSGAEEISRNIEGAITVAKESASSAQELTVSAKQLSREVQSLNGLINQFKVELRSDYHPSHLP